MEEEAVAEILGELGLDVKDHGHLMETSDEPPAEELFESADYYTERIDFHVEQTNIYRNKDVGRFLYHRGKVIEYMAKRLVILSGA